MATIIKDLGPVTAYSDAVAGGYTGTREEWEALMASYASVAETAIEAKDEAIQAKTDAQAAKAAAQAAQTAAETAKTGAEAENTAAQSAAQTATTKAGEASASASSASGSATTAAEKAAEAAASSTSAGTAQVAAQTAQTAAETAQGAAENAQGAAEEAAATVSASAAQIATNTADIADLKTAMSEAEDRLAAIEEAEGLHRYGVSGIGQSASALTRIWDSVGMTAQVGTDGNNSNVVNNFDDVTPFNRRKCVGDWTLVNDKPVFHVHAYYGDEEYAEDGTMGDYVAVECPRAYYYMHNGVLGVSAHQWQGWRPFDIFCRDHNPEDTVPYAYIPAYALALKDGKAVSLPGLNPYQGTYKQIMDACRTYDSDAGAKAFCQPMAVNFYEWALFTVEFAQQNCQAVMQGCAGLRHSNDDRATLRSDGKWLLGNYMAARVVGEYVSIQSTNIDINHASYFASHKITSIIRCDADGNESSSGAYQLIETEDLGSGRTYEVGESYRFAARPYATGACNGVSTPSGSPVSNTDSCHPMKYRWRENVYSNQFKTIADLFNMRVGTGDSDYYLEWYLLLDPSSYTPASASKPDATDLATDAFVKLDIETAHANYANGYVKSKKYSAEYPDVWIPYETSGASTSTYFADYANLVHSYVVRAVRVGGYWLNGSNAGFSYVIGHYAPAYGAASSGGDLFFPQ